MIYLFILLYLLSACGFYIMQDVLKIALTELGAWNNKYKRVFMVFTSLVYPVFLMMIGFINLIRICFGGGEELL